MKVHGMEGVITPAYQPIIDLHTGRALYFESLARSTTRKNHVELLRFAEGYGFIQLVDAAMISLAAKTLAERRDIRVGVNVSVATVEQCCGQLVSAIYDYLPLASRLVVEVTETMPIRNPTMLRTFMHAANAAGVAVAFDDFGDGNFTFEQLVQYRPKIVKLSEALIRDRADRRVEIERVMTFAAENGIEVVAEAIDSEQKRTDCMAMGIRYAQGFLVGDVHHVPEVVSTTGAEFGLRMVAG